MKTKTPEAIARAEERKKARAEERRLEKLAQQRLFNFAKGSGNYYDPHVYLQTTRG